MLTTNHPVFVFWGAELFCFYNDAYASSLGPEKHPAMLGARGPDMWPENWPIIGPQIDHVMSGKGATWHEDHLVPFVRHGALEDVYWTYGYSPIDDDGGIGGVLVLCIETTQRVLSERALRETEERLQQAKDATGFGIYDFDLKRGVTTRDNTVRAFWGIGADAPVGFGVFIKGVHPDDRAATVAAIERAIDPASGGDYRAQYRLVARDGEPPRWIEAVGKILFEDDRAVRFVGTVRDITEHKRFDEHRELLVNELNHRVKNTLANVQAIAAQTFRNKRGDPAHAAFDARLLALSRAHDILTRENWKAALVSDIVATARDGYDAERFLAQGPDLRIGAEPALSLAMTLHELATNAARHGALSNDAGKVTVVWEGEGLDGGRMLRLVWIESDGPPVVAPEHKGTGARFIHRGVNGGSVDLRIEPTGVLCNILMPLA